MHGATAAMHQHNMASRVKHLLTMTFRYSYPPPFQYPLAVVRCRFIPVFFVTEAGMSPALLCTLYGLVPLTVSATAFVARHVSRLLGRVLTLLVNRFVMGVLVNTWQSVQGMAVHACEA